MRCAFKLRGAYNALSQLSGEERARGVLAWSSGNHAQAVALASRLLGIPATIVMPTNAPAVKLAATQGYLKGTNGEVIPYDPTKVVREELGTRLAGERGLKIIPPYDHPHIIAGQGTAALELHQDVASLDAVFVPCGGGGLLSGSALATRGLRPGCKVIGVEPELADDATRSFHSGTLHSVHNPPTIADGARTPSLGEHTFPIVLACVDDMVTVTESQIASAMRLYWSRMKLVVEPTGAVPLAGALAHGQAFKGKRVGILISGGNVDPAAAGQLMALADQ